jgi:hypothetical protein
MNAPAQLFFVSIILLLAFLFFFFFFKGRKWLPLRIVALAPLFAVIGAWIGWFANLKVGVGIGMIGFFCFCAGVLLRFFDFLGGAKPRKQWGDDE